MCVAVHVMCDVPYVAGYVICCRTCHVCVAVHIMNCDIAVADNVLSVAAHV